MLTFNYEPIDCVIDTVMVKSPTFCIQDNAYFIRKNYFHLKYYFQKIIDIIFYVILNIFLTRRKYDNLSHVFFFLYDKIEIVKINMRLIWVKMNVYECM